MVSVIIPVYNGERFIAEAIESVLVQTYQDIEVIVVDDGSTDNTPEIVKEYPAVHYISQSNKGPSSARNAGMALAQGDFLAYLDADDLYFDTKIEEQVSLLMENDQIDVVYNDAEMVDKNLEYINTLKSEGIYENPADFLCMMLFRQIIPMPPSIMIRRKCYEAGIKYNESYVHAEDYEYLLRLAKRYRFGYIQKSLYKYRRHENNLTNKHHLQVQGEVNVIKNLGMEKIEEIVTRSTFAKQIKELILAKIFIKIGEYERTKNILEELVESHQDKYAWFYLGNCYYNLNDMERASECYKTAINMDPLLAEAYNNFGCVCASRDNKAAGEAFKKALKIRKGYMDAEYNYNQSLKNEKHFKITNRELRKVLTNYNISQ